MNTAPSSVSTADSLCLFRLVAAGALVVAAIAGTGFGPAPAVETIAGSPAAPSTPAAIADVVTEPQLYALAGITPAESVGAWER